MARMKKNTKHEFQWSDQLILFRYFLRLFGKDNLKELAKNMKDSEYEGLDENQNTFFWQELDVVLRKYGQAAKISRDKLKIYDENICRYVKQIGEDRGADATHGKINLKYFQYIACLFTEIYLDSYFDDKNKFADELNEFAKKIKRESEAEIDIEPFTPSNMNKLAFMCATGSGKTLIMHINILQFIHYLKIAQRLKPRQGINKIIVLAPNEGMSKQHLEELKLSNISAAPFDKSGNDNFADVMVIDMNKLKEEGKVKTVSVDSFEQNNLVLVDEAHRGLAGDVWYDYRSRLSAEGGFAFEYSATLKQAMKKTQDERLLLDEYFRSIIIDYSYKYFYEDGYGKEYSIYNLRNNINDEQRFLYLTGCIMSFYQQLKLFAEHGKEYASFALEKPLLVFVGNRVTARPSQAEMTDVEEVLDFIDKFVNNKKKTIELIRKIFNEDTGITDTRGQELFARKFDALKSLFDDNPEPEDVFKDILRIVFNSDIQSEELHLHLLNLRQVQGEIALCIGANGDHFGVISIGDTLGLIKNCETKGIFATTDEFINESLFRSINKKDSNINILIGSRKFTEGWNSWRVSTMGLINFAKGEGSQAIQLFGRGVRLRGYTGCLKRSSRLDDKSVVPPKNIELIETLTIFGIKAQYMDAFRVYLEREDMPINENLHEYMLPVISRYNEVKDKKLRVIKVKNNANFKKQSARLLLSSPAKDFADYLNRNKVIIDHYAKVQMLESTSRTQTNINMEQHKLDEDYLSFLDYERILDELITYKNEKLYYNISLCKENLEEILRTDWYLILIPEANITVDSMAKLFLYSDIAVMLLKNYIDKFYKYEKDRWEAPLLEYQELDANDKNFVDEYKISYYDDTNSKSDVDTVEEFVNELRTLLNQTNGIPKYEFKLNSPLVAFDFKKHLYTPLIFLESGNLKLTVMPVNLNENEKKFIDMLKTYLDENEFNNKSLFLIRNKSKVGMGFFEAGNFYPDFVMWINTPETQYLSFIDPKGLHHLQWDDPKLEFYLTIKNIEKTLQPSCKDKRIILNSFIMSGTSKKDLSIRREESEYADKNIFFLDDQKCIKKMIKKILNDGIS